MASSPQQRVLYLILDGSEKEISFDGRSVISFGRADECDVILDIPRVSRVHAEIRFEEGQLRLVDKRSSNGTLLNGERVDFARLRIGDRIEIGSAVIELRETGKAVPPSTSARKLRKPVGKSAGHESAADSPAGSSAGESRPQRLQSGPTPLSRVVDGTLMILLLLLMVLVGKEYSEGPGTVRLRTSLNTPGNETTNIAGAPQVVATPLDEGEVELKLLEQELTSAELGWDAIGALRSLARQYPTSKAATTCSDLATALEGMQIASDRERRDSLEEVLAPLILRGLYGEASSAAIFLSRVEDLDVQKDYWQLRADEIGRLARDKMGEIQEEVSALLGVRQPGEALRVVAAARARFAGIPEYETVLGDLVAGVADVRLKQPPPRVSPPMEWAQLLSSARLYLEECRYGDLAPVLHRAISLDLPTEDHIAALEMLVRAGALETMFAEFLEGASGGELSVNLSSGVSRIVRATRDGLELEREIAGGKMVDRRSWARINSTEKASLFRSVPHSLDGVMGLVFLAEIAGDDEGFHRALVNLHRRTKGKELAEAIIERSRSGSSSSGSYEEFEGRLVTSLEKEQMIEQRRLRKEREREAIVQAKRLRKSNKIEAVIEYVLLLREQGSFSLADQMLHEVVAQSDDAEQSSEARRLISDPYLAVVPLRESGPPSNRIDFFILGDGYQVEDQQQEAFLNHAKACEKILMSVDPYREYEQYFNVNAVHLQSKDMGVSREPGEIVKDTALGCMVRYDVLTSNGGNV
ncbi:MAG: FHA domain-containing protein, partial [Planctomycetota bacterium]